MLGAIFGDIVGSVYEFDNIKTKDFELFSPICEITDDTVMSIAVANALLGYSEHGSREKFKSDLIDQMHELGSRYPFMSYGCRFNSWLISGSREPYNSFGNGSAMRVSAIGLFARDLEEAIDLAAASAEVTHNHPEGIKGAVVSAGAVFLAKNGASKDEIRRFVENYYDIGFTLDQIRPIYFFNETCQQTVPQAMVAFLEADDIEDAIRNCISIGGDSDTLAAICGGVAEAFFGIDDALKCKILSYLDADLLADVENFYKLIAG